MVVFTKTGERLNIPYLISNDNGVYCYNFNPDSDYTADDNSVWSWDRPAQNLTEIIGVSQGDFKLTQVYSFNDVKITVASFFYDASSKILYINWVNSSGDWVIDRNITSIYNLSAGYANGRHVLSDNVFDGLFYDPRIIDISELTNKVDPLKFGLIANEDFSFSLANDDGLFDEQDAKKYIGIPVQFFLAEDDDTVLDVNNRIMSGYINTYQYNDSSIRFKGIEQRSFFNNPVCPNTLSETQYPYIGDFKNKRVPLALGDIRRGICVPLNSTTLTTDSAGTVTFLVNDPSIAAITQVTGLYNQDNSPITISSSDLTACTITATKPAGVSPSDLKDWTWSGKGCVLGFGTYNNPLDIIRFVFDKVGGTPYLASTYDQAKWTIETANNNVAIGKSVLSEKGFIEEIVQPATVSVQGAVNVLPNGKISFFSRNIAATESFWIDQDNQEKFPEVIEKTDELVSELVVNYAPNFKNDDDILSVINSTYKNYVIGNYGFNRREPLSPIQTIIYNETDAINLADEIMQTSKDNQNIIEVETLSFDQYNIFDIGVINIARFDKTIDVVCEVLLVKSNLRDYKNTLQLRVISGRLPELVVNYNYFPYLVGYDFIGNTHTEGMQQ